MAEANHTNDEFEELTISDPSGKPRSGHECSRIQSRKLLASLLGRLLARRWLQSKRLPNSGPEPGGQTIP